MRRPHGTAATIPCRASSSTGERRPHGHVTRRIVLATHNAHKVAELRRILADHLHHHGGIELVGLDWFPAMPDVAETGLTFADNALLKAHAVAQYCGLLAVADDSGLTVD